MINAILVDRTNYFEHAKVLQDYLAKAQFVGIDCETEDSRKHNGLKLLTKNVFDMRRTTLCGVSLYTEDMGDTAYYINVGHADARNRITHDELRAILSAKADTAFWVAHNAPFELTVFHNTLGFALDPNIICTLQMAVSAYGPHEYHRDHWLAAGQGEIARLMKPIMTASFTGLKDPDKMTMTPELEELVMKIIAKQSSAAHSYNGLVDSIAYGYSLKKAVRSHFGVQMATFQETLGDRDHMGQLTGAEVVSYGADDAFWCMKLFRKLMAYMMEKGGPTLVKTFFEQENPMAVVFSEIQRGGMKVNGDAIFNRLQSERAATAKILRRMKDAVKALLPFDTEPNAALFKTEAWYAKNHVKYRDGIIEWALSDDSPDDFEQCYQVRGPVSNGWAEEMGMKESNGPNFSHYMPVRVLLYDLIGAKPLMSEGKVQSDGEARGKLLDKLTDDQHKIIVSALGELAGVEQRMKLYLKPYSCQEDPETGRLYPTVTSMLATRRMAASNPNPMQLAKRGESTYVRGFFQPDYDDHVIVSLDWSAVELVEIGEFSGDPTFIDAFSTIPHKDLHAGAAADILAIECPGLTEPVFKSLKGLPSWEEFKAEIDNLDRLKTNLKGELLDPRKAYGYWRTEVGKGANFNYWYSGWLATIGERMGWNEDKTKAATDAYRQRFEVAEAWRVGKIEEVKRNGFITLHDGHRYVRYEATEQWYSEWIAKFCVDNVRGSENFNKVMRYIASKIQKRAGNQTVNADIQGSCATLAKRSVLRIRSKIREMGWSDLEARFLIPIHDELVFSVHKSIVAEFITMARGIMIDHPDMFKLCKLDSSPAVGLTFEPWHPSKAPLGQIELYEPPAEVVGDKLANTRLDPDGIRQVVDYLFSTDNRIAA